MFEANVARINQLEDTTAEQNQAMSDTKDKIHELEETIHKQAAQIAELKDICESSEHNRCRYNIIIWGLDEQTHSNPREAVHRLFSDLDLHFKADDRDNIYWIGPKKPDLKTPRPIMVQFVKLRHKGQFYSQLKKLKNLPQWTGISVMDDLTPANQNKQRELKAIVAYAKQNGIVAHKFAKSCNCN